MSPVERGGGVPRAALVVCSVLGALLSAPRSPLARDEAAALTNEDVVRLVMIGTPEKKVLEAIRARPVDFDLAPDIVAELRAAGVGEGILEAMKQRQAAMPRRESPAAPEPAPAATGTLEVVFAQDPVPGRPSERSAIALKTLPKGMPRQGGQEVGEMTDMALAILCTSTDHVPDHWEDRSLVRNAPRHELLLFQTGSAMDKVRGVEVLYLEHRDAYRVPLAEGNHNIQVAAVGKQAGSGTWRLLETDGARVAVLAGRTTRLTLRVRSRVRGSFMTGLTVESEWEIASVDHPAEGG
jgi:hypothetical protein